ncbi:hypothetical protein L207DRAFT_527821 [Hyaloscypha variabilis F]|uniref:PARP catalytic domain-containing protein n=1 Tax=Hyaloscypha variabilis (strain UAMH 11265 / GT02V1 / F) TaxID=1149755 RepID=A0A2J6RRL9_HYAVF|nr:hypothetical protein L207DRAFT_527821 [Hyaloscypha variabilis F]
MSQYVQLQQDGSLRIYFPLASYSRVRRTGWGLKNEQCVYVRVLLSLHRGKLWLAGFCVHLEGDEVPPGRHSPCSLQQMEPPERVTCGTPNRLVYQLSRIVWRYLRCRPTNPALPLGWERFHSDITAELGELAQHCIVCHYEIQTGNSLLRSTTCSRRCSLYFRQSQLAVRVPEMFVDQDAAGMLFWAMDAAIRCNTLNLVEGRPFPLTNTVMKFALSAMGAVLEDIVDYNTFARAMNITPSEVQLFISWVFTSYRGALITLPSLGGLSEDYRVFMANAKQKLEIAFAEKLKPSGGHSGVVFHGTTCDRLYPILHNGLQTQVRRDMMQWGNVLGTGIYTTDNSEVAMGYARDFAVPFPNRPIDLGAFVLLICELAEPTKHKKADRDPLSQKSCQIFVTTDPEDLILRAVVVATPGAELPHMQLRDAHRMIRIAR